jgi:hypothetical protein
MPHEDPADYPDDRNGVQLRQMAAAGAEIEKPRVVAFAHVISDPSAATEMARGAADLGYEVEIHAPDDGEGQWEIVCRREINLTYRAIAQCEDELAQIADELGGAAAGWG